MIVSFIGCGFSANSILYHLNKLSGKFDQRQIIINIFESRQSFGDGVSYNVNSDYVLLNRPAKHMSIDYNNLFDFNSYLASKGIQSHEYETRKSFGLYLKNVFDSTISSLEHKNIIINHYHHMVLDIDQIKNKFEIITSNGYFFSDIVILSTGNNFQNNIWHLTSPYYINNLYFEFQTLNQIKSSDRVLIIGASLSAIDCALFLESNGHHSKIGCMSRSGVIPKVRVSTENIELAVFKQLLANKSNLSLFELIKGFRKQIEILDPQSSWQSLFRDYNKLNPMILHNEIAKQQDVVQNILTSSNPYIEVIWNKLLDADKINFFNKFYTLYMSNRNPMPKISAERLLIQLKTNKLEVFSNEILSIAFRDNEFTIIFADGNRQVFNWIINATGQAKNIEINPLYNKLINHGLIRKNIIGGLDIAKTTQLCFGANGKITPGLYAVGPKTLGTYIHVNSAEMLSIKAECIAKQLIQQIRVSLK